VKKLTEKFTEEKFLQILEAERFLSKLQREREEKEQKAKDSGKILCINCGAIVRIPVSKKTGYGVVFTCFNCHSKYFVEIPKDALETIQEIAESAGKKVMDLDVEVQENFDTLKDQSKDEDGDVYHLYFVVAD